MQLRSIVDTELFDVIGDDEGDDDDEDASESDGDDASDASAGALSHVALSMSAERALSTREARRLTRSTTLCVPHCAGRRLR